MEIVTSFKKLNYGRFSKKEAPIFLFLFNKKKTLGIYSCLWNPIVYNMSAPRKWRIPTLKESCSRLIHGPTVYNQGGGMDMISCCGSNCQLAHILYF